MPPTIELPQDTYERLQAIAGGLFDIPTVVTGLVDFYESREASPAAEPADPDIKRHNPFLPPPLLFAKMLDATLDGKPVPQQHVNWKRFFELMVEKASVKVKSADELKKISGANIVAGNRGGESGFHYLPKAKLSVQGQDAASSWRATAKLARHMGWHLIVTFAWRSDERAAYPGETGRFVIAGR